MPFWQKSLAEACKNIVVFLKWLAFSCVIGILVGLCGTAFHIILEYATEMRVMQPWLLYFLPLAGLVIVYSYRICGMQKDRGTNYVMVAVRENEQMRLRTAPLIFLATALTHLFGGSAGREGAALQMGGAISDAVGRYLHFDEQDRRIITMCGMAAGFSALFGTPMASAIFAMEVVSVGVMYYAAIVPCALSALVAFLTARAFGVQATVFAIDRIPAFSVLTIIQVLILGCLCAVVAMLLCKTLGTAHRLYTRYLPNPYLRVVVGGVLVVALTLLVGTRDYNGAGMDVITRAISGQAHRAAFVLKILFTAITLAAGFKGGEIVPSFSSVRPLAAWSARYSACLPGLPPRSA